MTNTGGFDVMTTQSYTHVDEAVGQAIPTIKRIAHEVWQLAELSLQEVQSVQLIMDILQEQSFTIREFAFCSIAHLE
jgi:metal-dependent amidase/aminoacylase/carboxypeptidase family protein